MRDLFDQTTADLPLTGPARKGKRPRQIKQDNFDHVLSYFIRMHKAPKRLTELAGEVPRKPASLQTGGPVNFSQYLIDRLQVYVDECVTAQEWTRCLNLLARKKSDEKGKPARIPVNRETLAMLEALKQASGGLSWDELMQAMVKSYSC